MIAVGMLAGQCGNDELVQICIKILQYMDPLQSPEL